MLTWAGNYCEYEESVELVGTGWISRDCAEWNWFDGASVFQPVYKWEQVDVRQKWPKRSRSIDNRAVQRTRRLPRQRRFLLAPRRSRLIRRKISERAAECRREHLEPIRIQIKERACREIRRRGWRLHHSWTAAITKQWRKSIFVKGVQQYSGHRCTESTTGAECRRQELC